MVKLKAQIVLAGMSINYIANEINVNNPLTHNTAEYVGGEGSQTNYVSSGGRVLTFSNICKYDEQSNKGRGHKINDYKYLASIYKKKEAVLTSPSTSELDGKYIVTNFNYSEDTQGNYTIDWELTERVPFNVVSKTFRVWGKSAAKTSSKNKKTKTNVLDSNTKQLLKKCGLMSKGSKDKKCVKVLQKFLQSKGYYKNYKIDGVFEVHTENAVKSLQKKFKLKVTGKWDKNTRAYFQKKYKYPTAAEKSKIRLTKDRTKTTRWDFGG